MRIYQKNLLITGADHEERMKYATTLSMELLCLNTPSTCGVCLNCSRICKHTHPNVVVIEPPSPDEAIKIEQVRRLIEETHKAAYEEGLSIFIISHMHQLTKAAANALLKSIEESNAKKIFLALAPSRTAVLSTIASRLSVHIVKPSLKQEPVSEAITKQLLSISNIAKEERSLLAKQFASSRAELLVELNTLEDACHTLMRTHALAPLEALKIADALNNAMILLQKNVNPTLVVEHMLLLEWPYAQHRFALS